MADRKNALHFLENELTPAAAWKLYEEAESFNDSIKLYDTVKDNENFFIGKQWEGISANGLPTPVFNFIKRTIMFKVATITSDNLKVNVSPLDAAAERDELVHPSKIVSAEFEALMERNNIVRLNRELCRDAAVRGDGCLYTYWDPDFKEGDVTGRICTEVLQNTRVYFGDPNERRVQKQPYILIKSYLPRYELKRRAESQGFSAGDIEADEEDKAKDDVKKTDNKVTVLSLLWRDPDSGHIWCYDFTRKTVLRKPYDLGIRLYPVVWLNWDYIQDCYHGQAEVTGLIPNQVAYNKVWAASILSIQTTAFPKIMYDPTRIKKWSNQVGVAIPVVGGDMENAARNMTPPTISPQVYQYLAGLVDQTEKCMGVTAVAMGDSQPDNASAIIALQRAAATPMEMTKLNDREAIEDLFRIYLEFMAAFYGKRSVSVKTPETINQAVEFAMESHPELKKEDRISQNYDFSQLRDIPMNLKLDVGASSYYSEIASTTTMGEWMKIGAISPLQVAKRLPSGYLPKQDELIKELEQAAKMPASPLPQPVNQAEGEIPAGGGYSDLQRKINQGA